MRQSDSAELFEYPSSHFQFIQTAFHLSQSGIEELPRSLTSVITCTVRKQQPSSEIPSIAPQPVTVQSAVHDEAPTPKFPKIPRHLHAHVPPRRLPRSCSGTLTYCHFSFQLPHQRSRVATRSAIPLTQNLPGSCDLVPANRSKPPPRRGSNRATHPTPCSSARSTPSPLARYRLRPWSNRRRL
jgi:hypothetical protein